MIKIYVFLPLFALLFIACSTNQPQYVDSRDFVSFGLDNHDIDDIIKKQVDSLLKQRIIKSQSEVQILTIGAIDNESGENIDIEIIANELTRYLSNSEKFVVVNAGRDKKIEQILRDSRKMRENAEYNQYTTIEEGNLIAPHYALTGKITKKNRKILDDEINEYVFSFTLTDLKLGAVRWVGNEQIAKKLPKSEVRNFSVAVANKTESRIDSSKKNKIDSFESRKDSSKNHFIFGFDLAPFSFNDISVEAFHIDFADKKRVMKGGAGSLLTFPLNARVGYVRDIGNWSIGINALYNITYVSFSDTLLSGSWELGGIDYSQREDTKIDGYALLQRVGGEFVVLYQSDLPSVREVFGDTSAYLGVSVYGDFASKIHAQIRQTHENGIYKADFTRKISGLYIGLKAGIVWYFQQNMGMTYELNVAFPIRGENNASTKVSYAVFGLQWRI